MKEVTIFFPTNLVCSGFLHEIEFVKMYEWAQTDGLEDRGMEIVLGLSFTVEKKWNKNALL